MTPAANPLADDFWKEGGVRVLAADDAGCEPSIASAAPDDTVIFSSSGTTGAPKLTVIPRAALLASARAVNEWFDLGARDIFLTALPLHHVGGLGVVARAREAGAKLHVLSGRWSPVDFSRACADCGATVTSLVPTQVHDLVARGVRAPASLALAVVGGGHLECELATAARELGWPVRRSFGMTEASSQVATEHRRKRSPFGGAWLPVLPHWEVRIAPGGLLKLRGPALFCGRMVKDNESWHFHPAEIEDGWYRSSDYADCRTDDDGAQWLHPRGRSDDSVKIRGELVSLGSAQAELEGVARGSGADPRAFAVIDMPDERNGRRLVLVHEPSARDDAGRVRALFDQRAPAFARISGVLETDSLPRGALGKLSRHLLRELVMPADVATPQPD